MFILNGALSVLKGFGSILSPVPDLLTISEDKEMPKHQKIYRIGTNLLLQVTQLTAFSAAALKAAPYLQIGAEAGVGAADLMQKAVVLSSKENLDWGDYLDMGGAALLRTSRVANKALDLTPTLFGQVKESVQDAATSAKALGTVIVNRNIIQSSIHATLRYFEVIPNETPSAKAKTQEYQVVPPNVALFLNNFKKLQNIAAIKEIPDYFEFDRVLKKYKCPISKKPIRHLLVVAGTENTPRPVYYERDLILAHLSSHPSTKPPGWPANIEFTRNNLPEAADIQQIIDQRLTKLLEDVRGCKYISKPMEALGEEERKQQILLILKSLKLDKFSEMSDEEICDAIIKNAPQWSMSDVCVVNARHKFSEAGEAKPTKVIRFRPTRTLLGNNPLTEAQLFAATCATLFPNPQDLEALKSAQLPFDLYISTDLRDLEFFSELVKPKYERKKEMLNMMKAKLTVEQLNASPTDLGDRIRAIAPKKALSSVFVSTCQHKFSENEAAKTAKAITLTPLSTITLRSLLRGPRELSEDSLFAATRYIFGSKSEVDEAELSNLPKSFVVYVSPDFQDIQIEGVRPTKIVKSKQEMNLEILNAMKAKLSAEQLNASNADLGDSIRAIAPKKTLASILISTVQHKFSENEAAKTAKAITFTPSKKSSREFSEAVLFAAARYIFGIGSDADETALSNLPRPFVVYVTPDFQNIQIEDPSIKPVKSEQEMNLEMLNTMKAKLTTEQLNASNADLGDRIRAIAPKGTLASVLVSTVQHKFSQNAAAKSTKTIRLTPAQVKKDSKEISRKSLFAAARYIFGSSDGDQREWVTLARPIIIYVATDLQDIQLQTVQTTEA